MKYGYTLGMLLVSVVFSINIAAQQNLAVKVEAAVARQNEDEVEKEFRALMEEHIAEAELFFWKKAKEDCPYQDKMALLLGEYYRNACDYGKAYVFYDELLKSHPNNIDYLIACAEIKVQSGKEEDALELYERVVSLDIDNLPANIFIGNYYFFHAEKEFTMLKSDFAKLSVPTRMQYARYRENMNTLVKSDYAKAKSYLQRVVALFPSFEAKKILRKIRSVEVENEE